MKNLLLFVLLGVTLIIFVTSAYASSRTIYKTDNIENYLQMSLVTGRDHLIFNRDLTLGQSKHFREQVNGDNLKTIMVNKKIINEKYNETFSSTPQKIVLVNNENLRWKMLGTQLAYHLNCPVYFSLSDKVKDQSKEIILFGGDIKHQQPNINHITDFKLAYQYYRDVTKNKRMQIYLNSNLYGVMGIHFANYIDGFIRFDNLDQIKNSTVTWVTDPSNLREDNIIEFQKSMDFDGDGIYDYPLGILTGINASDLSVYIERIRYFKSHPHKSYKLLSLDTDAVGEKTIEESGKYKVVRLHNEAATIKNLQNQLKDSTYFHFMAHGSSSGFALIDGSFSENNIPDLPLQITVAESCSTGDIPHKAENSIALNFLRKGSIAYIGSFRVGGVGLVGGMSKYFYSTSRVPLGQLVRLQNYSIQKYADTVPRALLFGDPTINIFQKQLYSSIDDNKVYFENPVDLNNISFNLGLSIPKNKNVKSVVITDSQGRKETLTDHIGGGLIKLPAGEEKQVLFITTNKDEGKLSVLSYIPVFELCKVVISYTKIGLRVVFNDVLLNPDWTLNYIVVLLLPFILLLRKILDIKSLYLLIPYAIIYLSLNNWLGIKFSLRASLIYYIIIVISLFVKTNLFKKIIIYLTLMVLPVIPIFFIVGDNYRTLLLFGGGIVISSVIPILLGLFSRRID